ncbi:DUF6895 family protein [Actinokineospora sp. UTMC 2448]|uniref:DUF6895 family protein n=1 Tax=Actinokineospora sp. UTMC 2448 TaxID=2268449 RepID=UPI002164EBF0|nr:hypothetical protein [Actinokineospora sp. UTMC 2448]UVS78491.1 hypothetical protein Actkin_02224 [Actinokineospora sp. UTMC 2448]
MTSAQLTHQEPEVSGVAPAALRWLNAHRDDFRLPEEPEDPRHDRDVTLRPLGELARLIRVVLAQDVLGAEDRRLADELFAFAWRETGQGEVLAAIARREPFATYPLEIYAVFARAGLRHPGFDAQLRHITGTRAWRTAERGATRTLAVLGAEHDAGLPRHRDPLAALRETWLGGGAEPWSFTAEAGYAATHTVFHLTDWCTEPGGLTAELREHLRLWLPAWLTCSVEAGHWDLAGELLAVAAVLPEPMDVAQAWAVLASAQGADGAVAETAELARDGGFRHHYHSTLVTAFSAALTVRRSMTGSVRS